MTSRRSKAVRNLAAFLKATGWWASHGMGWAPTRPATRSRRTRNSWRKTLDQPGNTSQIGTTRRDLSGTTNCRDP